MMNKKTERSAVIAISAVCTAGMAFFEYAGISFSSDERLSGILKMIITRGLGSVMFTVLLGYLGYRVMKPRNIGRGMLFALPAFAVVINNLPILSLIWGDAYLTSPAWQVVLFAVQCLFIGIFEETAFRGAIFLILLEKRRSSTKEIFWVTVVSSAIFGGIHIFNLFAGAGLGPTIQQVGYSFLIGAMCAVVLLRTKNIWICVLLHAVYDFCGFLLPTLGDGSWWDTPTVIFTVILAVAVTVYMVVALLRVTPESINDIYLSEKGENENV